MSHPSMPLAACVPPEGRAAEQRFRRKPIVTMLRDGHPRYLTLAEAVTLRADLDTAISEAPDIAMRPWMGPIPGVDAERLVIARAAAGHEIEVAVLPDNSRAYHARIRLERNGFDARTKKIDAGKFVVYARWNHAPEPEPMKPQITLDQILEWIRDTKTSAAHRQAGKMKAVQARDELQQIIDAAQQFQNEAFGKVGDSTVKGRGG